MKKCIIFFAALCVVIALCIVLFPFKIQKSHEMTEILLPFANDFERKIHSEVFYGFQIKKKYAKDAIIGLENNFSATMDDNKIITMAHVTKLTDSIRMYEYIDDPDFDIALFSGTINDDNKACRGEFYAKKNYELAQEQSKNPSEDGIKEVVEQFENFVDCALGIDFPEAKRKKIRIFQTEMQMRDKDSAKLREDNVIDDIQYFKESTDHYEECLQKIADILTDEEFEALFQLKKSEIQGSFLTLLNAAISSENMEGNDVQ